MEKKKVYEAIAKAQKALVKAGLAKSDKNPGQGWNFRGIDALYNLQGPILAEAGLIILPTVLDRTMVEKMTRNNAPLFYVTLTIKYSFISLEDGSSHDVVVVGEAMDSSDKATNKAFTSAYKYLCFQAFCLPTDENNDSDSESPEPVVDFSWVPEMLQAAQDAEEYKHVFKEAWSKFGKTSYKDELISLRDETKKRLKL